MGSSLSNFYDGQTVPEYQQDILRKQEWINRNQNAIKEMEMDLVNIKSEFTKEAIQNQVFQREQWIREATRDIKQIESTLEYMKKEGKFRY